jgi:hypothetical protein
MAPNAARSKGPHCGPISGPAHDIGPHCGRHELEERRGREARIAAAVEVCEFGHQPGKEALPRRVRYFDGD